jgi:hypothetical protein
MAERSDATPDVDRELGAADNGDAGGDAACWANRVCQQCGRLNEAERPVVCEACGTRFR